MISSEIKVEARKYRKAVEKTVFQRKFWDPQVYSRSPDSRWEKKKVLTNN